jgi:hypothetical protein
MRTENRTTIRAPITKLGNEADRVAKPIVAEAHAHRHDEQKRQDADGGRVRPALRDQLDDAFALVLVREAEIEMDDVPEIQKELLVDRPVETVLLVEVVDDDL